MQDFCCNFKCTSRAHCEDDCSDVQCTFQYDCDFCEHLYDCEAGDAE